MDAYQYNQYLAAQTSSITDKQKADELKQRMAHFTNIATLKDAQKLAKEIMPTNQEITTFYSGSAKCTIVNRKDLLRITIETSDDFVCYDFK